jgi:hypothetical protein
MSEAIPEPPLPTGVPPDVTPPVTPRGYALVNSYETVQVLSPTTQIDVLYCTIQAQPSGVIASKPIPLEDVADGSAVTALSDFAAAIEQVMIDGRVIAGVGDQTIDAAGLIADNVAFTVQYKDSTHAPYGVTALATVPVALLAAPSGSLVTDAPAQVKAIIDTAYTNLKAAAGG